jgi:hypothetical protein
MNVFKSVGRSFIVIGDYNFNCNSQEIENRGGFLCKSPNLKNGSIYKVMGSTLKNSSYIHPLFYQQEATGFCEGHRSNAF